MLMKQPMSRSATVLIGTLTLALLAGVVWVGLHYKKEQQSQEINTVGLLNLGVEALNDGDYPTSIAKFQEGMNRANTPDERGYFETLLAASYENTDFTRAADLYLSVINNVSYSARTRGLAAAYLMKAVESSHNLEYGSYVFSKAPFEGFFSQIATNKNYAFEIAVARGNEWSVSTYPNFLSHFSLVNFYARHYADPTLPSKFKAIFYERIPSFAHDGEQELTDSANDPLWNKGLIAYGYSAQAIALTQVYEIIETGKYQNPAISLDANKISGYFTHAIAYADQNAQEALAIRNLTIYDRLYYAQFLVSISASKNKDKLTALAGEMYDIIAPTPANFSFLVETVTGERESTIEKRKTLVTLASLNDSLRKILEEMGALSTSDFK